MTKAQMAERIQALEAEVEALKAGASVETHIHYHYPPTQWQPSVSNPSTLGSHVTWTYGNSTEGEI